MLESKELRRSIMPIVVINSIFCTGLLEYFIDRSAHMIGFIYVFFAATSYCILFYILENVMSDLWVNQMSDFTLLTMHFQFFHNIIVYLSTIFAGVIRRKRVRLSMRQLENCTRAMNELGIPDSYSALFTYKYFEILCFSFVLISVLTCELIHFMTNDVNYALVTLYCITDNIPPIMSFIVDFSFIYWIRYTKIKLGQLNAVLRSMLTTTIESPQHRRVLRVTDKWKDASPSSNISSNSKTNEEVGKLKRIKHIHLELIKFARNTNEAYGLHILMSMATCFLLITTLLYNVYIGMISKKSILNLIDIFTCIYWICLLGLEVFFVNHVCAATSMEVRQFTYQIVQNPLTFTAYGFFDLDHTFISSTIGSVTTYLVILIQVGHGSKKESSSFIDNSTSTV